AKTIAKNKSFLVKFQNGDIWKLTDWCPQGRLAEDGKINPKYPLKETPTPKYKQRTEYNIYNAEVTLIILLSLAIDPKLDKTTFTIKIVKKYEKL
ncbi:8624_t:CDS:1, partial [Cetraspora pellucida]